MNTRDIDMLNGSLWDKIILFALPLALTGVMQQLLNAADVVTLGKFVGKHAMAAVGNNTSMVGLIVSLMMGLSLGANVVIAQNIGAQRIDRAHIAASTAFVLAIAAGIFYYAVSITPRTGFVKRFSKLFFKRLPPASVPRLGEGNFIFFRFETFMIP